MQAAVNARWFDTRNKKLGDEYRDEVFANQQSIVDLNGLRQFTEKFAQGHGVALPFAIDPMGKLQAEVKADYALGQRIDIEHTPTIWVVTANSKGAPFVEVVDRSKLFQLIDQAQENTKETAAASHINSQPSTAVRAPNPMGSFCYTAEIFALPARVWAALVDVEHWRSGARP